MRYTQVILYIYGKLDLNDENSGGDRNIFRTSEGRRKINT